jgi:hypothetical protein
MAMTLEEKYAILSKHIKTAAGRQKIAASMIQPLRKRRDYQSVGRRAFYVEQLPDGALPIYDKDADVAAYVIGEEGDNIISVVKPKRVMFPLFEIAANPEIPLTEIKARRFDLIERAVDLGSAEIMAEEDRKIFATMDAVCDDPTAPNQDIAITGNLTAAALADGFAAIERSDIRVATIFCNARDYSDLRKWDRDVLDPDSQAQLLKTGIRSGVWNATIITSRMVPEGTVYICGEPEFFGRMPVRTDLTILSADTPKSRLIGFSMFEQLGVGIFNPYAIVRMKITRA